MAEQKELQEVIAKFDSSAQHISSIAALKRLGAHEEVKVFWQKGQAIIGEVDWQAQHDALFDISKMTRTYSSSSFKGFYTGLPRLIRLAKQAEDNAKTAAESLAKAAAKLADLVHEVDGAVKTLSDKEGYHKYWEDRDRGTQNGFNISGHVLGPLTLGLGYLLWLGHNDFKRRAEDHVQARQIIKDVQGVLKDQVKPVFSEASEAMDAAALFFNHLIIQLEHMLSMGTEAAEAPVSELHLHYEEMGQLMGELRASVDKLSAVSRHEQKRVQHTKN